MNYKTLLLSILFLVAKNYSFGQENNTKKQLDSLFTVLAEQNQFNGSVLIADKGKIVYQGGKGYSNETTKALNNTKTVFELASCSKQFIGVGIALLHRQGKIAYTDDITKYIPSLSNFKGVSIYNLLRHTSGIPEYLGKFYKDWKKDRIATNQDLINYYANQKDTLEFKPNAKHEYCNTNYALLASIIELVSGQDLNAYLTANIFKPLKMDRTFIYNRRLSHRKIKNYAYGYTWIKNSFEKAVEDDKRVGEMMSYAMDGIIGNAKVNSTVEDIYKWHNALKSNKLLTQQEFDQVMESSQTTDNKKVYYGFGFEVRKKDNNMSYGHTGNWDGYITFTHHDTIKDRTIIVLNNFNKGTYPYNSINEILDGTTPKKPLPLKIDLPETAIQKFLGIYIDPENPSEKHNITYLNKHLVYNTDKLAWDMRFFPIADGTFQAIRQGGVDGVMKFTPQNDGTMKLEMTQYGQKIGGGIRKKM